MTSQVYWSLNETPQTFLSKTWIRSEYLRLQSFQRKPNRLYSSLGSLLVSSSISGSGIIYWVIVQHQNSLPLLAYWPLCAMLKLRLSPASSLRQLDGRAGGREAKQRSQLRRLSRVLLSQLLRLALSLDSTQCMQHGGKPKEKERTQKSKSGKAVL